MDALNNAAGVTRAQAAAMYGGAMYGWNSPMLTPRITVIQAHTSGRKWRMQMEKSDNTKNLALAGKQ